MDIVKKSSAEGASAMSGDASTTSGGDSSTESDAEGMCVEKCDDQKLGAPLEVRGAESRVPLCRDPPVIEEHTTNIDSTQNMQEFDEFDAYCNDADDGQNEGDCIDGNGSPSLASTIVSSNDDAISVRSNSPTLTETSMCSTIVESPQLRCAEAYYY